MGTAENANGRFARESCRLRTPPLPRSATGATAAARALTLGEPSAGSGSGDERADVSWVVPGLTCAGWAQYRPGDGGLARRLRLLARLRVVPALVCQRSGRLGLDARVSRAGGRQKVASTDAGVLPEGRPRQRLRPWLSPAAPRAPRSAPASGAGLGAPAGRQGPQSLQGRGAGRRSETGTQLGRNRDARKP